VPSLTVSIMSQIQAYRDHYGTAPAEQYKVPPIEYAFVHLNNPLDVALVGQVVLATGHVRTHMVGQSLGFDHPKVRSKVGSWNIADQTQLRLAEDRVADLTELRRQHSRARFIGTVGDCGMYGRK
jgi:hypothetical protein